MKQQQPPLTIRIPVETKHIIKLLQSLNEFSTVQEVCKTAIDKKIQSILDKKPGIKKFIDESLKLIKIES